MGCNASKEDLNLALLDRIDDSVHVMLEHDKKVALRKGEKPHGYVPREPHPLLTRTIQASEEDDTSVDESLNADKEDEFKREEDLLLWHAKNHSDTIDPRDAPAFRRTVPQLSTSKVLHKRQ